MSELLTMQDLANGHLDVKALGEAANGDENTVVTTRTGNTYPSAERAINIMFKNGGLPAIPFPTKALMEASSLGEGSYAIVTDDVELSNGIYLKEAGVWKLSKYNLANIITKGLTKPLLFFFGNIIYDFAEGVVTYPGGIAVYNGGFKSFTEMTLPIEYSIGHANLHVYNYDSNSFSQRLRLSAKLETSEPEVAVGYAFGKYYSSPYKFFYKNQGTVRIGLPNRVYNGNFTNSGEGVDFYSGGFGGLDNARPEPTYIPELALFGCFNPVKLSKDASQSHGVYVNCYVPFSLAEASYSLYASFLLYSDSGDFDGITSDLYYANSDGQGGEQSRGMLLITDYQEITPKLRRYYVRNRSMFYPIEGMNYVKLWFGVRNPLKNVDMYASGFWLSLDNGKAFEKTAIDVGDTDFPNWDNVQQLQPLTQDKVLKSDVISDLVDTLYNPLTSVKIRFIGDSITWGVGSSNTSTGMPRSHSLTDMRNNTTNNSFVNLVRKWINQTWADYTEVTSLEREDGSPTGETVVNRSYLLDPTDPDSGIRFYHPTSNTYLDPSKVNYAVKGGTATGRFIDIGGNSINLIAGTEVRFDFVGETFKILFAGQGSDAVIQTIDVYLNGELYDSFSAAEPITWDREHTITAPYGKYSVAIKKRDYSLPFRFIGIESTKRIYIANDGISGTSTTEWLPGKKLFPTIQNDDDFVFVQLGTNDRHMPTTPTWWGRFKRDLTEVVDAIQQNGVKPIMLSANINDDSNELNAPMNQGDISRVIRDVAKNKDVPFINNFASTSVLKSRGDLSFTTDGLHPNDNGHQLMAENIIRRISQTDQKNIWE